MLVTNLWVLFNKADVIIAHNGNAFDLKKVRTLFLKHRLPPPEPYKQIDTKLIAKRYFNFDSNSLKDLAEYLGLNKKLETGGYELWRDCENGVKKAWKTMGEYNDQDVKVLEELYLTMLPYMDNHPNIGLLTGELEACPNCGSFKIQKRGFLFTRVSKYQRIQCMDCGAWSKQPIKGGQIR
jgi:DNA polymerase elongation subunit (family B)